jgi:Tfp pilus assembly protein PilV
MTTPRRRRRGYILIEVTIAAAITAVALVALLGQAGEGLVMSSTAARDLTAQGLVNQGLEEIRALGFTGVATKTPAVVVGMNGEYTRGVAVTPNSEILFGTTSSNYKDVTVTVTRKVGGQTLRYEGRVRVYE